VRRDRFHSVHPPIHYARSGDLKIAYQVTGDGPIDLIWTPGTVSHFEEARRVYRVANV
jgi:hypothetical protein